MNTIRIRVMAPISLDYTCRQGGSQYVFASTGVSSAPRSFALPAGTYTLTFKHPNATPVGTYPSPVVVKPYTVAGGACGLTPIDKQVGRVQPAKR